MIISDLEHLENLPQPPEITGGLYLGFSPLFQAVSAFKFDSLVLGYAGAFAGGESNVLTTAFPGQFSVGFTYTYQSMAIGLPPLLP